jgi:hypothetical protein
VKDKLEFKETKFESILKGNGALTMPISAAKIRICFEMIKKIY